MSDPHFGSQIPTRANQNGASHEHERDARQKYTAFQFYARPNVVLSPRLFNQFIVHKESRGRPPDELTGKCSQRFQFPSANQRPLLVPLALTWVFLSIHEGDTSRQYVTELRRIAAETPMFPGSRKIRDKVVLKRSRASLFSSYATHVAFDEIESFYKRELPARGWSLPKGHSLINFDAHSEHYRRGDYCIAIESEASIFGSNGYSVVFRSEEHTSELQSQF